MNKGKTKYEIALEIVSLLKKENEKMASLLPNYKPSQEDVDNMIFWDKLLRNQFIEKE